MSFSSRFQNRTAIAAISVVVVGLVSFIVARRDAGDREDRLETHLRFIEEDPHLILSAEKLLEAVQVFSWRLGSNNQCLEIWPSSKQDSEIRLGGHEARLRWQTDRMNVFADVPIDTTSINRIDVFLQSIDTKLSRTGRMMLQWISPGEKFSQERTMRELHGEVVADNIRRYRFSLANHPAWRSTVSRLRLVILPPLGSQVALCSIVGSSVALRPERIADLAVGGIKVALGGQYRNALPGLPDYPFERGLKVPRRAELRFAYGLQPGVLVPMSLRVTAIEGGRSSDLFEASLNPADAGVWRDVAVTLAPLSGRRVTLRLATSASGSLEKETGIALWANPEVVAPRR